MKPGRALQRWWWFGCLCRGPFPEGNLENVFFFWKGWENCSWQMWRSSYKSNAIWEIIYEILELYTYSEFSHEVWMKFGWIRKLRKIVEMPFFFRFLGRISHTPVTKFRWSSIEFDEMILRRIVSSFDLGLQFTEVCSDNSSSSVKLKVQNEISCDMRAIPAIILSWNLRI